ncbi:uncharacterized protein LOC114672693 [Macaca mulatta]
MEKVQAPGGPAAALAEAKQWKSSEMIPMWGGQSLRHRAAVPEAPFPGLRAPGRVQGTRPEPASSDTIPGWVPPPIAPSLLAPLISSSGDSEPLPPSPRNL